MLNVVCCLWGEFPDPGWSMEYVRRLKDGVARNLSVPHRFICFADREFQLEGVEVRELKAPVWRGNLPKTFVYSPEANLEGRVLLFDLDNVIVGSLDDMAAYRGPLCVRGRLLNRTPRPPDGDMIAFDAASSTAWHLWKKANSSDVVARTQGKEREFILWAAPQCDQWQDVCPGQVVSYRHGCVIKGGLPQNARVVSCHGRPRPHEIKASYVADNWV